MVKKLQTEFSFLLKISILFFLMGMGVYFNQQNENSNISELLLTKESVHNIAVLNDSGIFSVVFEK